MSCKHFVISLDGKILSFNGENDLLQTAESSAEALIPFCQIKNQNGSGLCLDATDAAKVTSATCKVGVTLEQLRIYSNLSVTMPTATKRCSTQAMVKFIKNGIGCPPLVPCNQPVAAAWISTGQAPCPDPSSMRQSF